MEYYELLFWYFLVGGMMNIFWILMHSFGGTKPGNPYSSFNKFLFLQTWQILIQLSAAYSIYSLAK